MREDRFWNSEQSWCYECTMAFGPILLRCNIRRNAHDFQSYLHVSVFSPVDLKWNRIASRQIEECQCHKYSYVDQKTQEMEDTFKSDAENALQQTYEMILIPLGGGNG